MSTRLSRRHWPHLPKTRKLFAVASLVAAVPLMIAAANTRSATAAATAPSDCNSSFDPYAYTQAAVSACGYQTFPLAAVNALPDGGSSYDYSVNGSTVRFFVPPAGFDPSTATDAQLDEYGFPERPTDSTAYARWQAEMSDWKGAAPAPPFLAESHARADTTYSGNWAGYAVTGGYTYTHAEAWYIEPTFYSSRCTTNADVTWAGIGGYSGGNHSVGQDGTAHNVPGVGNHQAWWEIYPYNFITAVNLYGHRGYEFDASTRWLGNGYRFYMHDYYTGHTVAFDAYHNVYDGSSAEAITERPTINGSLSNLSNFETMTFEASNANGNAISTYDPNKSRHGVHMENFNNGDDLADPSGIGGGGYFTVTQHNCN